MTYENICQQCQTKFDAVHPNTPFCTKQCEKISRNLKRNENWMKPKRKLHKNSREKFNPFKEKK